MISEALSQELQSKSTHVLQLLDDGTREDALAAVLQILLWAQENIPPDGDIETVFEKVSELKEEFLDNSYDREFLEVAEAILDTAKKFYGNDHLGTLEARYDLALDCYYVTEFEKARMFLSQNVDLCSKCIEYSRSDVGLDSYAELVRILIILEDYDRAVELSRHTVALHQDILQQKTEAGQREMKLVEKTVIATYDLTRCLQMLGTLENLKEAEATNLENLEAWKEMKSLGSDKSSTTLEALEGQRVKIVNLLESRGEHAMAETPVISIIDTQDQWKGTGVHVHVLGMEVACEMEKQGNANGCNVAKDPKDGAQQKNVPEPEWLKEETLKEGPSGDESLKEGKLRGEVAEREAEDHETRDEVSKDEGVEQGRAMSEGVKEESEVPRDEEAGVEAPKEEGAMGEDQQKPTPPEYTPQEDSSDQTSPEIALQEHAPQEQAPKEHAPRENPSEETPPQHSSPEHLSQGHSSQQHVPAGFVSKDKVGTEEEPNEHVLATVTLKDKACKEKVVENEGTIDPQKYIQEIAEAQGLQGNISVTSLNALPARPDSAKDSKDGKRFDSEAAGIAYGDVDTYTQKEDEPRILVEPTNNGSENTNIPEAMERQSDAIKASSKPQASTTLIPRQMEPFKPQNHGIMTNFLTPMPEFHRTPFNLGRQKSDGLAELSVDTAAILKRPKSAQNLRRVDEFQIIPSTVVIHQEISKEEGDSVNLFFCSMILMLTISARF